VVDGVVGAIAQEMVDAAERARGPDGYARYKDHRGCAAAIKPTSPRGAGGRR
jgi:hypothetical protein